MPITIATNVTSIAAQRNLAETDSRLQNVLQRLSTGSRIVTAADDPAGLAISDREQAQIRSLNQAIRNTQDGVSLVSVFEGGTSEISNMLARMRELATQSATDTIGDTERLMINSEVQQLKDEINRTTQTVEFAGNKLLNGGKAHFELQVGFGNDPQADRITIDPGDSNLTTKGLNIEDLDLSKKEKAQQSLKTIDDAMTHVDIIRSNIGAAQNRLTSAIRAQSVYRENLSAANSRLRDTDVAAESANLVRENILRRAGIAVLSQANETPTAALQLLKA